MKISFTGASGTGKTSVAKQLFSSHKGELADLELVGVNSRGLLDKLGLQRAEDIGDLEYKVFQTMYFSQKLLLESKASSLLTERSFADGLAYWKLHCEASASRAENAIFHRLCREQTKTYDRHFLFPTDFLPLEDDGYRHGNPDYHREFELVLRSILDEWMIEYVEMPRSDITERARFVLDYIQ